MNLREQRPRLLTRAGLALLVACLGVGLEGVANAEVVRQSTPQSSTRDWYATIKESFKIALPEFRIHNNGSVGKGWVRVWAKAYNTAGALVDTIQMDRFIPDATSIYVGPEAGRDLVINDVELIAGQCWTLELGAQGFGLWAATAIQTQKYCWDATRGGWTSPINSLSPYNSYDNNSVYIKKNVDFSVSFNWFVSWRRTVIQGRLSPANSTVSSGYYHDFPNNLRFTPHKLLLFPSADAVAPNASASNPDLWINGYCELSRGPGLEEGCHLGPNNTETEFEVVNMNNTIPSAYTMYLFPEQADPVQEISPTPAWAWTTWISRDYPSGGGDGEYLSSMISEGYPVCNNPVDIQCRRISDSAAWWSTTDAGVTCEQSVGLGCANAKQSDGTCDDYEVRFLCPR